MAFDSTVPNSNNLIEDDLPAMRENFSLLEDSQIVDDNLDDDNPSNGWYEKLECGFLICFGYFQLEQESAEILDYNWDYPTTFINSNTPDIVIHQIDENNRNISTSRANLVLTSIFDKKDSVQLKVRDVASNIQSGDTLNTSVIAIGRWK